MDYTMADAVLVVEDDAELREMMAQRLHLAGFAPVTASNGHEALQLLRMGFPAKLILLDLKLPKVDGLEVLKRIRSDERTKSVPVVILTSSNEERDRIASYELGVNSYVVKPVDFDSFARAVAEIGCYWVLMNKPPYH